MKECTVDKWCWISVVGKFEIVFGDHGYVLLVSDDISSEFEADIKRVSLEGFPKQIEPLAEPKKE